MSGAARLDCGIAFDDATMAYVVTGMVLVARAGQTVLRNLGYCLRLLRLAAVATAGQSRASPPFAPVEHMQNSALLGCSGDVKHHRVR